MTTLQRVSKFIAESNLSEDEIHEIILDLVSKRSKTAFVEGWSKRERLQRRSKQAQRNAQKKNADHEQDLLEYQDTDYSALLSPNALIARGDDLIEVEHLHQGDIVKIRDEAFTIKSVEKAGESIVLNTEKL